MAQAPARRPRKVTRAQVQRSEQLTPHMIRVVLGGPGLAEFDCGAYTDHYVKLLFPVAGVDYPEPWDMEQIRAELPREQWPMLRTYTVRRWDAERGELTLDFVHHGDEGIAGPWAAQARPGQELRFLGPGGGYAPDPDADWHLLVGDESALPAIAATLEAMPAEARVHAFIEVADAAEEMVLRTPAKAEVTWLHRGERRVGERLLRAVAGFAFPDGTPHAFVHGEAGFVKELRRLLRHDRGLTRDRLSISGYWRLGLDEDDWQSSKAEWNRQVEAEQEGA